MALTHETIGDVLVVVLPMERLDAGTGQDLQAEVEPHFQEEAQVVFDLGRVESIDSAGLAVLLSCLKGLVAIGGDLKLCALTPRVLRTFEETRLPRILEIHPTREDAVASYL